jgi:hypothetical protein
VFTDTATSKHAHFSGKTAENRPPPKFQGGFGKNLTGITDTEKGLKIHTEQALTETYKV